MGWVALFIVVATFVLMLNHGGNKDRVRIDKICSDRFGNKS